MKQEPRPKRRHKGALLQAAGLVLTLSALPAAACDLTRGEPLVLGSVVDGQGLMLADGREVKLADIDTPKLAHERAPAWPYAEEARSFLDRLLRQGATLAYDKTREDRYGRILAFPLLADGQSAQARMVEAGFARVMGSPDNRACLGELLALEAKARTARRGIWADPFYRVLDAHDVVTLARSEGRFEIVEGKVREAASIRGRLYLNFGDDRHADFTVTVAPVDAKLFKAGKWAPIFSDLPGLAGRKVRIRGIVESFHGPEIVLTHPEQIEFLDQGKEPANGGVKRTGRKARKPRKH